MLATTNMTLKLKKLIRYLFLSVLLVIALLYVVPQGKLGDKVHRRYLNPEFEMMNFHQATATDKKGFLLYPLKSISPLIDKGIDFTQDFKLTPLKEDINGASITFGEGYGIGAFEFTQTSVRL
jgi:hypothetical protein